MVIRRRTCIRRNRLRASRVWTYSGSTCIACIINIMAEKFYIKQNDTKPVLRARLLDSAGNVVNVTGATVVFSMRTRPGGATKVDKQACTINTAVLGAVQYAISAANTNTADRYEGEFQVTFSDASVQSFPNNTYIDITVTDDVE